MKTGPGLGAGVGIMYNPLHETSGATFNPLSRCGMSWATIGGIVVLGAAVVFLLTRGGGG